MFTTTDTCYGSAMTFSAHLDTLDAMCARGTSAWIQVPGAFLGYNQEPKT